jgi:hypothetical protein
MTVKPVEQGIPPAAVAQTIKPRNTLKSRCIPFSCQCRIRAEFFSWGRCRAFADIDISPISLLSQVYHFMLKSGKLYVSAILMRNIKSCKNQNRDAIKLVVTTNFFY